jgi:hypothetical protein
MLVAIGVVAVGGGAFLAIRSTRPKPPPPPAATVPSSEHGAGIDKAMAANRALYYAPLGNTPCESAYNAFKASYDLSQAQDVKPMVLWLAPRDEFLAQCGALPADTQQCLVPAYLSKHRDACQSAKPSRDALKPMVEMQVAATTPDQQEPPSVDLPPPPPRPH